METREFIQKYFEDNGLFLVLDHNDSKIVSWYFNDKLLPKLPDLYEQLKNREQLKGIDYLTFVNILANIYQDTHIQVQFGVM